MSQAWAIDLPDSEKIVLLALADCANDEGLCWPSMASLAKKCSKSERTVQGCIKALADKGHLTRNEVIGRGCRYVIHPRNHCTPAAAAPPQRTGGTPAAAAPKPSKNRNSSQAKACSDKRAIRLPLDWRRPEMSGVTSEIWNRWPISRQREEIEAFRDYWAAKPGKDALKLDWDAAWRTWVKNAERFHPTERQHERESPC